LNKIIFLSHLINYKYKDKEKIHMFKFIKSIFSSKPSNEPHPLDSVTKFRDVPYKLEPPSQGLVAEVNPPVVYVAIPEQSEVKVEEKTKKPAATKKPRAKKAVVEKVVVEKAPAKTVEKKPRGRKPKAK
jgi:hypothetical protein